MSVTAFTEASAQLRGLPCSLPAEQAVLGAVLFDNATFDLIEGLEPRHFHEPFHERLWTEIGRLVGQGRLADAATLPPVMGSDPAWADMGGARYLLELIDKAPIADVAASYAETIKATFVRRELIRLARETGAAAQAGDEEPEQLIARLEAGIIGIEARSRSARPVSVAEAAATVLDTLDSPPETAGGILTGLGPLDDCLGPLLPGDLVLFMGRPSMGKSAAAECVALNIARRQTMNAPNGCGVLQINGEMSAEQMARRHLTDLCFDRYGMRGPKYSDLRKRLVSAEQRRMLDEAQAELHALPIAMLKRSGMKFSTLRSVARRQAAQWDRQGIPLTALIVDHVGLIRTDEREARRYEAQTIISNDLKALAEELGCVVIGLNQMNRENERRDDKRPQLADLRDSGSWEQDADFVIGWYREAYYAQREPEPRDPAAAAEWDARRSSRAIEAIVLKAREGETRTCKLWGDVARNAIRGEQPESSLGGRP